MPTISRGDFLKLALGGAGLLLAGNAEAAPARLRIVRTLGRRYLYAKEIAAYYGFSFKQAGKTLTMSDTQRRLQFTLERREGSIGPVNVNLLFAPFLYEGSAVISEADFQYLLNPVINLRALPAGQVPARILIDPGHGGDDPGCMASGTRESNLTLAVAKLLSQNLATLGFKAALTRSRDSFISLEQRSAMAASWKADLFVSLHINSVGTRTIRGPETHIFPPRFSPPTKTMENITAAYLGQNNAAPSACLGYELQRALVSVSRQDDRSLKHSNFHVIRECPCPGALVELGYISNPEERALLVSKNYQETLALAIATAIRRYRDRRQGTKPAKA